MAKANYETKLRERAGYSSYFVGQNILYMFTTLYLSMYYTNALGIHALTVGTILLAARVWDAAMDPILSVFVEKSKLKGGKFKPWINSVSVLVPLLTILMFAFTKELTGTPEHPNPEWIPVLFATVTYFLWGTFYTLTDAPGWALSTVMTHNPNERNSIIAYTKMLSFLGILITMIGAPMLVQNLNNDWFLVSCILSLVAMLFMVMVFFVKERVRVDLPVPTIGEIVKTVFGNKYLVVLIITLVLFQGMNFGMTITPYLANDVFHDQSLTGAILGMMIVPMVLLAPFTPWLIRKFGKNTLLYTSVISTIVGSVAIWVVGPSNVTLFLVLSLVKSLFGGFFVLISTMYFADCVEYDFLTKGRRFEAATFAAQTFSTKILTAVSGAGGMWLLAAYGFRESKFGETVVQSQATVDGMWHIYNLGPAVGAVLALLVFWKFYDLNEKKLAALAGEPQRG